MIYKLLCFLSFVISIAHSYSIFYRNQTNYHFLTLSGDASTLLLIKMRQDRNAVFTYNRREGLQYKQALRKGGSAQFNTYFPSGDVQYSAKYGMNKPQLSRDGKLIYSVASNSGRFKLKLTKFNFEGNYDDDVQYINMQEIRDYDRVINFALGNNHLIQSNENYGTHTLFIYEIEKQYPHKNIYRNQLSLSSYYFSRIKYIKMAHQRQRMFILFNNGFLRYYRDILNSLTYKSVEDVQNAIFISHSFILLSFSDNTLSLMETNGSTYKLDIEFNMEKNNFVVSNKLTHFGFVSKQENILLPHLQVFYLFKIDDILFQEMTNKTIIPELRIIEVGTFLSVDVSQDGSVISYIRSYGSGQDPIRELVVVERTPGTTEVIYPCYNQFYQQTYPQICGKFPFGLKITAIVLVFLFLVGIIVLIVIFGILQRKIKDIADHLPEESQRNEHEAEQNEGNPDQT